MRLPRFRLPPALPRSCGAFALLAAVACVVGPPRRVDSSWAPLQSSAQIVAMNPTLLPYTELQLQMPQFGLRQPALPSGLRSGLETGETRGMVAVVTIVGSGSGADPPGHEGLAHLVEHLVYHAHRKGERPQSGRLLRLGAHYNGGTTVQLTQFYEVAPAASLPGLLDVVAERIQRPLDGVDADDFEHERAIVENELNQRTEMGVTGRVVAWLQTSFFPAGHPFARSVGGSKASLRRLTLADARAFVDQHYRPSNIALLVTGEQAVTLAAVASQLPASIRARDATSPQPAGGAQAAAAAGSAAASAAGPAPVLLPPQARPDTLTAAVALPEIWVVYDLGGGGYDSAIAKILASRAAETAVRDRLMPVPEVLAVDFHDIDL